MKFRYQNPYSRTGRIKRYLGIFGLFVSWNLVGIVLWRMVRMMKKGNMPEIEDLSLTDQNLTLMGYDRSNLKRYRVSGFKVVEEKDEEESEPVTTDEQS